MTPTPPFLFSPMVEADLNQVIAIEEDVYCAPWTYGNFSDALRQNYQCWVLHDAKRQLLGYFILMYVVDEAHLLNISVHRAVQSRGFGKMLLDKVCTVPLQSILLEVRPSNTRALHLYQGYGFVEIGRRRDYYPPLAGKREEAIVMRLVI